MIIDVHCHIGMSWIGWQRMEYDMEKILKIYDKIGVDIACVNSWQINYDIETGNKEVYAIAKKYPKRIIGFGIVNPRDRSRALDEIKRCVEDYGFKGLKLHPASNNYMIDSTLVGPVIELARSYSLPVLIHSSGSDGFSHPRMIGSLAGRYPEVNMIIGHMGTSAWLESVEMAKNHENIYLDTTAVPNEVYIIPIAIKVAGADRIMWGTDSPMINAAVEMAKIKTADLYSLYGEVTEKDKGLILGGNIARILGININKNRMSK